MGADLQTLSSIVASSWRVDRGNEQKRMRLKLVHQAFGVIVLIAVAAELAMALAFSVSLQRGFSEYLTARDKEDLARLVAVVDANLTADSREASPDDIDERLRDAVLQSGFSADVEHRPRPPIGPPPFAGDRPPPFAAGGLPPPPGAPSLSDGPSGAPPVRNGPPDTFSARVLVFDAEGRQIMGPPPRPASGDAPKTLAMPFKRRGEVVGRVEILPRRRAPSGVDSRFLAIQSQTAAIIGAIILILCILPAWLIARVATRRLEDIRAATKAVASGDLSVTLSEGGAMEVADTIRNINAMTRSLQRLESARRRWLAEVSHELRTPLTALRGEIDAMLDDIRPMSKAALASVNEEAMRLNAIIDDLHLLAVADLDGPICRFEPADASAICRAAVDRFSSPADAKGLKLTLLTAETELPVLWDSGRIDQVLANLLTNSLRYTDTPGETQVSLAEEGDRVLIRIEDSAPCPSAEDLPRLFEALYRGDDHRSRLTGGSGLGLSVCEAIVRAHGGTIQAEASKLGGLAITLRLPRSARSA